MSIVGFRNFGGGTVTRRAFFALSAVGRSAAGISLALLVAALAGNHAYGADCPDNKTARKGFVLERPGVRTVVRLTAEQVAIVNNEFASASPQTQFLAGGLIEVFRTSSKGQFVALPTSDFRDIFPLKQGKEQEIRWLWLDAKKNRVEPSSLSLKVAGKENVELGACRYEVLAVRQVLTGDQGQVIDAWTALYSPDLQAVLAKRYDEGTAKEDTVAFETIRALVE